MDAQLPYAVGTAVVCVAALVYFLATSGRRARARQTPCGGCGKGIEPWELSCPSCGFIVELGRRASAEELAQAKASLRDEARARRQRIGAGILLLGFLAAYLVIVSVAVAGVMAAPLQVIGIAFVLWLLFSKR